MSDDFAAFAATLPAVIAAEAHASEALADAYWRARRAGHDEQALVTQARSLGSASNPVGLLVARLRKLADTPPPVRRAGGMTTRRSTRTHGEEPVPMPDWFRQAWHEMRAGRRRAT